MKYQTIAFATSTLVGLVAASPYHRHHHVRRISKREVPQEHSHEIFLNITREFLNKENPKAIADPVFGLLGDAAAKTGAGQVTNLACLQQETADQAFTNAKAAKDIRGMSAALVYQTLERNTAGVGDPAADGAAANNKEVALALAKQLAAVGGDPMLALESGTFAPGDKSDTTFKGLSCDTDTDPTGCIFTEKKLVLDATPDEITAAAKGVTQTVTGGTGELKATHIDITGLAAKNSATPASGNTNSNSNTNTNTNTNDASCDATSSNNGAAQTQANNGTAGGNNGNNSNNNGNANSGNANTGNGNNVQTFTGSLGGAPPPVIQSSGNRPFSVNGDTFVGKGAALGRSCDVQHNACARAVNSGQLDGEVSQCDEQNTQCRAQASLRKRFFKRQATDFGSCSDPSVVFKDGLPDRQAAAFIANNQGDFNHGSAQKIGIIAGFICQRLSDSCKAPAATVESCNKAQSAAVAATQDETAANVFNSMLIGGSASGNVTARGELRLH
ncbi:hypothetical protein HER10_EVM0004502 [Colletotrichum scovillei]|uniref:uncharacterized protein n=1 Tax=Colletotrichum scovillei TaxID=1209932 RepID=UPI0015C2DA74|nr:uncharacterized protein HER10_EVM0004502 [Colletotrichum scovillei]KAF4781875.1 hypothetical protein HER10_EVM0004502 [Colletotrichum scovillei]